MVQTTASLVYLQTASIQSSLFISIPSSQFPQASASCNRAAMCTTRIDVKEKISRLVYLCSRMLSTFDHASLRPPNHSSQWSPTDPACIVTLDCLSNSTQHQNWRDTDLRSRGWKRGSARPRKEMAKQIRQGDGKYGKRQERWDAWRGLMTSVWYVVGICRDYMCMYVWYCIIWFFPSSLPITSNKFPKLESARVGVIWNATRKQWQMKV